MLKKIIFLAMLFAALFFVVGCGDTAGGGDTDIFAGTWSIEGYSSSIYTHEEYVFDGNGNISILYSDDNSSEEKIVDGKYTYNEKNNFLDIQYTKTTIKNTIDGETVSATVTLNSDIEEVREFLSIKQGYKSYDEYLAYWESQGWPKEQLDDNFDFDWEWNKREIIPEDNTLKYSMSGKSLLLWKYHGENPTAEKLFDSMYVNFSNYSGDEYDYHYYYDKSEPWFGEKLNVYIYNNTGDSMDDVYISSKSVSGNTITWSDDTTSTVTVTVTDKTDCVEYAHSFSVTAKGKTYDLPGTTEERKYTYTKK